MSLHENILDFVFETLFVAAIVIALSLFFLINSQIHSAAEALRHTQSKERLVFQGDLSISHEEQKIIGAEIISALVKGSDYDIEVNGIIYEAGRSNEALTLSAIDPMAHYDVMYAFDPEGYIEKILYESR